MSFVMAGDVGGTRARFALFAATKGRKPLFQETLQSGAFDTFEAALTCFLSHAKAIHGPLSVASACFGIAGPVVDQRVRTTNLPWTIDARRLAKTFRIAKVRLVNDLVAMGFGALAAPPSKLHVVQVGRPKARGANVAVIAAGTGLGEAAFLWNEDHHLPCATEGSHVDFAAQTDVEFALRETLAHEHGHVSYERVASGSTISRLYRFLVQQRGVREAKANQKAVEQAADANVAVVELAERGVSAAARQAIDLWSKVYGAEAGNLALKTLSTGGVFVCGGVSARLAPILTGGWGGKKGRSAFVEAFLDKGRMRPILEAMPVAICLESQAGLLGAAAHARAALG